MAVVPRDVYKKIEWHFHNYAMMKAAVLEYEEEVAESAGKSIVPSGTGHGIGRHSDTTAMLAIDAIEGGSKMVRDFRDWLWVVERVMERYKDTQQGQIIKMYYRDKLSYSGVSEKMGIAQSRFYELKGEIVMTAYAAAAQKRLIKVF